ncbi:hypothetical protein [Flagellimonas allohymeniacidonis]|uniref:Uncharacterized protein n=1 Tax=Flagellimonas allohymeniacidonis TaxID=2517819 RepID=A0A4Q8QH28_9FLAO|nr:hypothetical protein [Allomuricauda hymeniacidonis]TAI47913.1 hypothetical protein EW142_14780 [Allomuricauda hymeniacidonis]
MKKKKKPSLFPNHDLVKPLPDAIVKPHKLELGTTFRVGNPANNSYLFLSDSLNPKISTFKVDVPVSALVDEVVTITGILELSNAKRRAVLERKDQAVFYDGQNRIYADVDNAIVAQELIAL